MSRNLIFVFIILLTSCNGLRTIKTVFNDASPYEQYVESLKKAELLNASMTREWLQAGENAFKDSVIINVPFSEAGSFHASAPRARSYRFTAKDGQVIAVKGTAKTQRDAAVFLELFVLEDDQWERIAWADSTFSIQYEFSEDTECVVRLQPELLVDAWYAIQISATPALINPVYGASNKAIGSLFGAPRDNGKRTHEGVDIFAKRGTPVIAPADGYITRVGFNKLGGKVVWMRDRKRHHSYYFAHLDSQMVRPGMQVRRGHVLGLVGNTGNAKVTPPHLHFAIYQYGSKDPLYYIRRAEIETATSLQVDTSFHQQAFKVSDKKIALRTGPSRKLPLRTSLDRNTYVTIIGQTGEWYRVALPDDREGYLLKEQVQRLSDGEVMKLDTAGVLFAKFHPNAVPVASLDKNTSVEVLAQFQGYRFIITENGTAGWLYN